MSKRQFLNEVGVQHVIDWIRNTFSQTGHQHTASDVGLENVENKSSETIRSELTEDNVVTALGYEPSQITIRTWSENDLEG